MTGLAIGPTLLVSLLPLPGIDPGAALGFGAACSAVALLAALHPPHARPERMTKSLLQGTLPRDIVSALPALSERRRVVAEALFPPVADLPGAPPGGPEAVAAALSRIMAAWNRPGHDALDANEVTELFLLTRLLQAPPDHAGALAQHFSRPDTVLDMRDTVRRFARERAAHDRQHAAYEATLAAWRQGARLPAGLLAALQGLGAPDADLWHHVVVEHDRTDPAQRAAALWCVRQNACDRATVAVFLSQLAIDRRLQSAAQCGETLWLDAVHGVIEAWNAGAYSVQEIALNPPDAVARDHAAFSAALGEVAAITGQPRWSDPCGAFTEYRGRPLRARSHWCLRRGLLVEPPDPTDYAVLRGIAA